MVNICTRFAAFIGTLTLMALPGLADYQSGSEAYYKGDFRAAFEAWLPLAEAGDPLAQNSLGALYDHGLGVTEDNAEAVRWYEMAAQQGMPLAMRNLGNQYATGHGVPYDIGLAQQWYEKAAALGDQQSNALLAHLSRTTTPPVDTSVTTAVPTFTTPIITGNLAEPSNDGVVPVQPAEPIVSNELVIPDAAPTTTTNENVPATPAPVDSNALVIPDLPSATNNASTASPPVQASDAPIALDLGNSTVTMPSSSSAADTSPAAEQQISPATQQASAVAVQPTATRVDGNWLIGQWQGPSLGCPKSGGIEFTETETLSWFDGQVAVRLTTTYQVSGENIILTAKGSDGTPQQYTYQRSGPDKMITVSIPQSMPKSLLGIAYRRCNSMVTSTSTATIPPMPPVIPIIGGGASSAPLPSSTHSTSTSSTNSETFASTNIKPQSSSNSNNSRLLNEQENLGRQVATSNEKVAAGWAAFEQGNYSEALSIFKSEAEAGNTNMQVFVGNMYDYGQGVPQDDVQALQWYLMAASKGNTKGQYQAAQLYFNSPSVKRNNVEAYRWSSLAAKGPVGEGATISAKHLLSVLTANMTEDEIDDAKDLAKTP